MEPHLITRIEAPDGEVLWEVPQRGPRVLDHRISYLVRSVLEDVVDRGTNAEGDPEDGPVPLPREEIPLPREESQRADSISFREGN